MYNFLSRIYLLEVDEKLADAVRAADLPELDSLKSALNKNTIEELAVDYARTFLSAGVAQGRAAFPYESMYRADATDPAPLYAAKGLEPDSGIFKVPSDHIGLELAFVEQLDDSEARDGFLREHILSWYKGFCRDAQKFAETDFYMEIARLTQSFLDGERGRCDGV